MPCPPPNIRLALRNLLHGRQMPAECEMTSIAKTFGFQASSHSPTTRLQARKHQLASLYATLSDVKSSTSSRSKAVVLAMADFNWTTNDISSLPVDLAMPLHEAIRVCQFEASTGWPAMAYDLIGRTDLAKQSDATRSLRTRSKQVRCFLPFVAVFDRMPTRTLMAIERSRANQIYSGSRYAKHGRTTSEEQSTADRTDTATSGAGYSFQRRPPSGGGVAHAAIYRVRDHRRRSVPVSLRRN